MKATVLSLVLVGVATASCSKTPATLDQALLGHWRQSSEQIAVAQPGWKHAAPGGAPAADQTGKSAARQIDLYIDKQTMWTVSSDGPKQQDAYSTSNMNEQRGSLVLQIGPPGAAGTAALVALSDDRKQLTQTRTITSPAGTFTVTTVYSRVDGKTAP